MLDLKLREWWQKKWWTMLQYFLEWQLSKVHRTNWWLSMIHLPNWFLHKYFALVKDTFTKLIFTNIFNGSIGSSNGSKGIPNGPVGSINGPALYDDHRSRLFTKNCQLFERLFSQQTLWCVACKLSRGARIAKWTSGLLTRVLAIDVEGDSLTAKCVLSHAK